MDNIQVIQEEEDEIKLTVTVEGKTYYVYVDSHDNINIDELQEIAMLEDITDF